MEAFIEEQNVVDFKDEDLRDADIDLRTDDLVHTEELNMSGNQLTLDNGQLTNAIAKSTIKKLDLSKNNIGAEGVKRLASLLLVNKSLQTLDLSGNNISDLGLESLATSFKINTTLRTILLNDNTISDHGAKKLVDALEYNNTIERVDLCRNKINSHVVDEIKVILRTERTRKNLSPQQWLDIIVKKDEEIAKRGRRIALLKESLEKTATSTVGLTIVSLEADLHGKNVEIALLRAELQDRIEEVASLEAELQSKNEEIESLEAVLKNSESIDDTVSSTIEGNEPGHKRPRTADAPMSSLVVPHEQNQQHCERLAQIKQEKNAEEAKPPERM